MEAYFEKIKEKFIKKWNYMDSFCKVIAIASFVVFVLFCVSVISSNDAAIVFSIFQFVALVVAMLIHKNVIKVPKSYIKYLLIGFVVLFIVFNISSYNWNKDTLITTPDDLDDYYAYSPPLYVPSTTEETEIIETTAEVFSKEAETTENALTEAIDMPEDFENTEKELISITKGTEYAYMSDEWNVYIATAISDGIIKIENWNKTMTTDKTVSFEYAVGSFKINDKINRFAWLDNEHTAFEFTFTDKNNSSFKRGETAIFTINIDDSNKNKGSNYSEKIACYSFQNDDWHLYRAILLTDSLIKIEAWYRGSSSGTFLFGYDVGIIDIESGETDFEWTDDEHTSFAITMKDAKNKSYWKKDTFVVYELENEDYVHTDISSYLKSWEVGEGEAAIPGSEYDFIFDNYKDVQSELERAGFTNITTEIKYDIIWGWTQEGEVDSVLVNGRTNYEKGEVFKQDTPIVITYHMKVEDDPNAESKLSNQEESTVVKDNITVENNEDFDAMMKITDQTDYTTIKMYVDKLKWKTVEFDGCVGFMMKHEDYKTRFDVCIVGGDCDSRVYGPLFSFENVNYFDMNVSGTDTVSEGMLFRITAKIVGFNEDGGYVILEPVALKKR